MQNRIFQMCVFGAVAFVVPVMASDPKVGKDPALEVENMQALATIEMIMEGAVQNIARRYNLNEAQTRQTGELMKREVHRFLEEHEAEVWPTIRGLLGIQSLGADPKDIEKSKRIGKAARPLAKLAKEAIFRANTEWRQILTSEQREMHNFDLSEMELTFEKLDKNFESWEKGEASPGGRIFPQPARPGVTQPSTPPLPKSPGLPVPVDEALPLTVLDTVVAEFIKDYGLDEGQITAAHSILAEFKGKAKRFKKANKDEYARHDAELKTARENRDIEKIREVTTAQRKLLKPFHNIVSEMEGRLKGLLTSAQVDRFAEKQAPSKKETKKKTKESPPKEEKPTEKPPVKAEKPPQKGADKEPVRE